MLSVSRNVDTHRHSCMSFQSLTLGWLARVLAQALEEYLERLPLPSSPLAGMPDRERDRGVILSTLLKMPVPC